MRGIEPLIAMRRRGVIPARVDVETDLDGLRLAERWAGETPHHAVLLIEADDNLLRLDLRVLLGLTVHVNGSDPERVSSVAAKCRAAGASRVIAVTCRWLGQVPTVDRITDTQGELAWPC